MARSELARLRARIKPIQYLEIVDEASDDKSLALLDGRSGLGVVVSNDQQLTLLIRRGANWYLNSKHNVNTKFAPPL